VTKTEELIAKAVRIPASAAEIELQRRSFAFGNAKTENELVTHEMIEKAAEKHPRNG